MKRILRVCLALFAAASILLFLWVALTRLWYPYELEWMEGGMHEHVRRLLAGEPIYAPPSVEFTAFLYPPFYYAAGGVATLILGEGLPSLRMVSLVATLGLFVMVFLIIRRETGRLLPGLVAAGLLAACFRAGGAWFDLARNDSLFLFFVAAGLWSFRWGTAGPVVAAFFFAFAFFTKQTALIVAFPLAAFSLTGISLRRAGQTSGDLPSPFFTVRALLFPGLLLILVGGGSVLLHSLSGGWYGWYVFSLPRQHALEASKIAGFWFGDLLPLFLPAALLLAVFLFDLFRQQEKRHRFWFWVAVFAGLTGAAWFSRMHSGGYDNVLLPAHLALALGAGAALGIGEVRLLAALILQFGLLIYDPTAQIPTQADREAGDRLVGLISRTPGDVWIPFHGHLATLAGKRDFAQGMALDDVFRAQDGRIIAGLEEEIREGLRSRRFGAIILDYTPWGQFQEDLDRNYEHRGHLFRDPAVLMPVTGLRIRPEELYVRREAPLTMPDPPRPSPSP